MKRIAFLFVAVVTVAGVIAWMAPSSLGQDKQTDSKEAKQIIVTTIPPRIPRLEIHFGGPRSR
jgi:hypothetical protein